MPSSRRLRPVEVTRSLEQTTKVEMDLRLEARRCPKSPRYREGCRLPGPKVDWSARAVTSSPWSGSTAVQMSDVDALRAAGHDLNKLD